MSPPESSSSPGPPNVFRQAFVFYVVVLVALLFSFALASVVAGVLEAPSMLFMLLVAPLLVAIVLFIQVDTLVERRIQATLAESTDQPSGGRTSTTAED